ncbi:MAG: acyltransferase family protein [Oceanihabitans sp.]
MSKFKLSYSSSVYLDIIRAVSSQLVVVGHAISFLAIFPLIQPPKFPYIQNIAVLVFFILSGFLISYSIFRKDNYSFKEYFIDRFSRIYAGLIPSILVVFIIDYVNIKLNPEGYNYYNAFNIKTFIGNLFMLEDFPGQVLVTNQPITSFGSGRTLWTLAVEWWLYMAFGYFIIKIWRKKKFKFQTILVFSLLNKLS